MTEQVSQPTHEIRVRYDLKARMRDDAKLSNDVFLPRQPGRYPTILLRTPYETLHEPHIDWAVWWAKRGYAVVIQDCRGRFESEGTFYPYRDDGPDGHDTLEWISTQAWYDGKIGTSGRSYGGLFQWQLAPYQSPYLTAMAPQVIMGDYFGDCHRIGGAVQWTLTGCATVIFSTSVSLIQRGAAHIFGNSAYYRHLPLIDIDVETIGREVPWYRDWCTHTVYDDYWKALDTEARLPDVHVPVVQQAAWYDPYTASMLRTWSKLHQRRSDQKIYVIPWTHHLPEGSRLGDLDFGPGAVVDLKTEDLRCFDYWLKGVDTEIMAEPPVKLFVMGENVWRYEHEWPLARTRFTPPVSEDYDVIVVGIGGMGSATAYHLARRGQRVLGLERFEIPHAMGSSHGITRIIRLAYYEHPSYVPLLQRSFELWRELQAGFGEQLLYVTGSIDAGPPDSAVFVGSLESCRLHGLPHQVLNGTQINERFPAYALPADIRAVFQPDGGFLLPERCVVAHAEAARLSGAEIHTGEPIRGWEARDDGVRVWTDAATYRADRLVLTVGAWASELVGPVLQGLAVAERQVLIWLGIRRAELFTPQRFPVFNVLVEEGRFYGFPEFGVPGFKFGKYHHRSELVDPDGVDRVTHAEDEAVLRVFAERYFPDGAAETLDTQVCMFTNSPDEHFIIDVHPDHPRVTIAAGFSGHGFKFCSIIGEIMADLALDGHTRHDIGMFRLSRFAATPH